MQAVVAILKDHWISLASGLAAILFIVVAVMGMTSDSVTTAMNQRLTALQASQITSLKSSAKNQQVIEAERDRGRRFEEEFTKTVKAAEEINKREPLMEGVFPKPDLLATPYRFVETYRRAVERLPVDLLAGTLPTAVDIQEEQQNVEDLKAQIEEREKETRIAGAGQEGGDSRQPPAPPARPQTLDIEVSGSRFGGQRGATEMQPSRDTEPRFDPVLRARVTKARNIRTYYNPNSFHITPVYDQTSAPSAEEMWIAQVSLWIQQDIVKALDALNRETAERNKDTETFVEHMPVKHLVSLVVHGMSRTGGQLLPFPRRASGMGEATGAGGGGGFAASSTGPLPGALASRSADEQVDVVRFQVSVVVDQRDALRVIDRVTRQNFFKCLGVRYDQVPAEHTNAGYLYGTAPCVLLTMEFEGYLLRAIFDQWTPQEFRALIDGGGQSENP